MKQHCRLIQALIAGLLVSAPAVAQQELAWQLRESEGAIFLAYEVPETSDQVLVLRCDTKSHQFAIHYQDDRDRVRDGMRAEVGFASDGGRRSLEMVAEQQELGDQIILAGETTLDETMIGILTSDQLRVTLSEATETIPLKAAQTGVAALVSGCRSK